MLPMMLWSDIIADYGIIQLGNGKDWVRSYFRMLLQLALGTLLVKIPIPIRFFVQTNMMKMRLSKLDRNLPWKQFIGLLERHHFPRCLYRIPMKPLSSLSDSAWMQLIVLS